MNATIYENNTKNCKLPIITLDSQHYNTIANSDLVLVASGTATLEAAILNTPMIIIYKVSFATWLYARCVIKIPFIGLANVVAQKQIVPEFVQYQAKPELIAKEAMDILTNKTKYNSIKKDLAQIKTHLGSPGASRRAAESITALLQ